MVQIISQELDIDERESTRLLGILIGTIINGVVNDGQCYVGKLGKFYTIDQEVVKNLKHWNGKPAKRVIFRPSLSFSLMMKSMSRIWH